jgi:hypothetical protein
MNTFISAGKTSAGRSVVAVEEDGGGRFRVLHPYWQEIENLTRLEDLVKFHYIPDNVQEGFEQSRPCHCQNFVSRRLSGSFLPFIMDVVVVDEEPNLGAS